MLSFTAWRAKKESTVTVVPYRTIPGLEPIVQSFLDKAKLRRGECYNNAIALALHPEIKFVLGRASELSPSDHAWNSFAGQHFDLTAELAFEGLVDFGIYTMVAAMTHKEAQRAAVYRIAPTLVEVYLYEVGLGATAI